MIWCVTGMCNRGCLYERVRANVCVREREMCL